MVHFFAVLSRSRHSAHILSYACHMGPGTLELVHACLLGLGEGGPALLGQTSGPPAASSVVASGVLLTVPELLMKRLYEPKSEDEAAAAAASMSSGPADGGNASPRKICLKVKKKNGKATIMKEASSKEAVCASVSPGRFRRGLVSALRIRN